MQRINRKTIFNFFATLVVVASGLRHYETLRSFIFFALASIAFITAGNLWQLRKVALDREGYLPAFMPILYFAGLFGTVAASSTNFVRMVVVVVCAYVFYFYEQGFPNRVPQFIEDTFSLLGTFMFLVFVWALNFFFSPSISGWVLMLVVAAGFFTNFRQLFYKLGIFGRKGMSFALVCALLMTQVAWAILYWPVNFLTAAVTQFAAYYVMYTLGALYFRKNLTRDKIYFQIAIILVVLIFSLISSPWRPVL